MTAVANPLRAEILRRSVEPTSPKEIATALGEPLGTVSYHVRILTRAGLLKLDRTEPRRGAVAHYYAVPPSAKKALRKASDDLAYLADAL